MSFSRSLSLSSFAAAVPLHHTVCGCIILAHRIQFFSMGWLLLCSFCAAFFSPLKSTYKAGAQCGDDDSFPPSQKNSLLTAAGCSVSSGVKKTKHTHCVENSVVSQIDILLLYVDSSSERESVWRVSEPPHCITAPFH